jgi:hypothetical protein
MSPAVCENIAMLRIIVASILLPALLLGQVPYGRRPRSTGGGVGSVDTPPPTFLGKLKTISKKELRIDVEGEVQSLTFHVSRKTHFVKDGKEIKIEDIPVGVIVAVDAKRDPDLQFSALNVVVNPPKPKTEQPQ